MSVSNRANTITNLHKVLSKHFKPVPAVERSLLELLLYACFLEDSKPEVADECFARMQESFFDWNEVRVTTVRELTELIRGLVDPARTATQLKQTLHSIFEALYNYDLEPLKKQNLGIAVKQLQQYRGTSPFMVAYVVQHGLGGHQIPVSTAALEVMYAVGALDDSEITTGEVPGLERAIAKSKGPEFASLLQQFAAEFAASPNSTHVKSLLAEVDPDYKARLARRSAMKAQAEAAAAAAKLAAEAEQAEKARQEKAAADKAAEKGRKDKGSKESKEAKEAREAKDAKDKDAKDREAAANAEASKKKDADKRKDSDKKKDGDKPSAELEKKVIDKSADKAADKSDSKSDDKVKDKNKEKAKERDEKRSDEKLAHDKKSDDKKADDKKAKEKTVVDKVSDSRDKEKEKDKDKEKDDKEKKSSSVASKSVKKAVPKKPASGAEGAKKKPAKKGGDAKKPPKTMIKKAEPGGKKSTSKQLARRKPR